MHYFVMKAKDLDLAEVKFDLQLGSPKSNYFFQALNMSHRRCFDLVRAFHCVRPELSPFESQFYLGTSGFTYAEPFLLKYCDWIQLHISVKSPMTFLSQQEIAAIYEVDKAVVLCYERTDSGKNTVSELRRNLLHSLLSKK